MWPDRVSNPGPPTYESGALPIALRGPALCLFEFSQSKPLLQIDTLLHPSRVNSITRSDLMEYKSELHT